MFKTALTLTGEELKKMALYARARVEEIESARAGGWLADRDRFEREWDDDFSHRQGGSAVFCRSNESLNMVGSGVDFIRSKILEEVFGGRPWFSVDASPRPGWSGAPGDQIVSHLRWKMGAHQINFEGVASDLVTQACKLGECVAKIFYKTDEERLERIAVILWDEAKDAPVLTETGEFIFRDGRDEANRRALAAALGLEAGEPVEWSPGEPPRAAAGPQTPLPPGLSWRERIISERAVHYSGAKAVPLHFREFFCPLDAPSIHEADFVAHLTKLRLSQLCGHLGVSLDGGGEDYPARVLREIRERTAEGGESDPEFRLLEAYFEFDARGEGRPCRVFLLMAYDFDLPIFWDYIGNVTPGGSYPFEAVVINKEPHRWHGRSWFKKYEKFQSLIDKLLNQILYRNDLAANPVKFRRKEAVVQWQDDQPLEIGPDRVFDLNDGYSAEDALQTAEIPELDEQTRYLLETVVASWRTRSGITTATQGMFGGLPSEHTATGVTQIVQSGATIFKPQVLDIKRGLEAVLRQLVRYQYACQAGDETYTYLENGRRVRGTLCRESVEGVEVNVELTLIRARQNERLEASRVAVDFFTRFLAVPDEYKAVAAPLFETVYRNLEIDNAADFFQQIVARAENREGWE